MADLILVPKTTFSEASVSDSLTGTHHQSTSSPRRRPARGQETPIILIHVPIFPSQMPKRKMGKSNSAINISDLPEDLRFSLCDGRSSAQDDGIEDDFYELV